MIIIQNFIVLEGNDGSGTSTQLALIRRRFDAPGASLPLLYNTCEPTGGPIGVLIRKALGGELSLQGETLARLFAADRHEHLYGEGGIIGRARRGELVISDRYVLSSLVYQGITCGEELPRALNAGFPLPEALLYFDVDPELALKRMEKRPSRDIYEYPDFQRAVRERYGALLPWYADQGVRVHSIDASMPQEEVAEAVWRVLENLPIVKGMNLKGGE
ncbi:MAG: dTMP kinase [Treponema sp.]|nr:dTMP kinase [Treponema sp.]